MTIYTICLFIYNIIVKIQWLQWWSLFLKWKFNLQWNKNIKTNTFLGIFILRPVLFQPPSTPLQPNSIIRSFEELFILIEVCCLLLPGSIWRWLFIIKIFQIAKLILCYLLVKWPRIIQQATQEHFLFSSKF